VFREVASAAAAIRSLQGRMLFDKPVRAAYARDKSDAIAKTDGTYPERMRARTERREQRKAEIAAQLKAEKKKAKKKRSAPTEETTSGTGQPPAKIQATAAAMVLPTAAAAVPVAPRVEVDVAMPNNILFVEGIAPGCDEPQLSALFAQFPGFREAKLVPNKQGLAFVEYDNEVMAGVAMAALAGFKFDPDHCMRISYAKR
jgi:RNA recognition motif-containing protein